MYTPQEGETSLEAIFRSKKQASLKFHSPKKTIFMHGKVIDTDKIFLSTK